jgi:hypothetical protein
MDLTVENQQLKQEVINLKQVVEKMTKDIGQYQIGTPLCPIELTMTNFEQHKKDRDQWYSPPFYTHPKGYKMCLVVYADGFGDSANIISIFLTCMRGEYDNQLRWPFQGRFTIQLLSQNGDERPWAKKVSHTSTHFSGVGGEQAQVGFIAHSELKPVYLQNDCLKFCISNCL